MIHVITDADYLIDDGYIHLTVNGKGYRIDNISTIDSTIVIHTPDKNFHIEV